VLLRLSLSPVFFCILSLNFDCSSCNSMQATLPQNPSWKSIFSFRHRSALLLNSFFL
jgi:hypothetical protein